MREEHALDRMCRERRNLQDELLRLQSNYTCTTDPSIRILLLEQQQSVQQKLDYVQEEIVRAQKAIVELDDEQVRNVLVCILVKFDTLLYSIYLLFLGTSLVNTKEVQPIPK